MINMYDIGLGLILNNKNSEHEDLHCCGGGQVQIVQTSPSAKSVTFGMLESISFYTYICLGHMSDMPYYDRYPKTLNNLLVWHNVPNFPVSYISTSLFQNSIIHGGSNVTFIMLLQS